METISSVETAHVLSGPSQDVSRVAASNDEVAIVAEQTSHNSGVVAVVNAEDIGPVLRLVDFLREPSTDGATSTLHFEEGKVIIDRDPVTLTEPNGSG